MILSKRNMRKSYDFLPNKEIPPDSKKCRSFLAMLFAAGDLQR
jgi:hypothetical protein